MPCAVLLSCGDRSPGVDRLLSLSRLPPFTMNFYFKIMVPGIPFATTILKSNKALLVYERAGLLVPAVKDDESGYRYYSADNMTQIRSIRSLQQLGLSLKEVQEYYLDTGNMDAFLARLMEMRAELDRNIQLLHMRATKNGELTVRETTLPQQVCYCKRYVCSDVSEAAIRLRQTYIAAARTGMMSKHGQMFTMRMPANDGTLDLMCCIPVEESFHGPERAEFSQTPALCVYYRGAYEGVADAFRALLEYGKANGIHFTGPFRSIFLEGPPNRGPDSGSYITQIAVPVLRA